MHEALRKYDPVVDKRLLLELSGLMWTAVGIALCNLAYNWLSVPGVENTALLTAAGTILSLLIHHFGFLKLVDRNITRIVAKEGKVCVFAFQPWKSYLIIMVMIAMGITLRHSSLPKPYLAIIYIGFGGAMLLSSIRYHRVFIKLLRSQRS
ncbi:MAG: hypothetical protein OEU95_00575 [Nitrospirota bacterium]|nr:hypothetical protein [Nitrospirota bacterium]